MKCYYTHSVSVSESTRECSTSTFQLEAGKPAYRLSHWLDKHLRI